MNPASPQGSSPTESPSAVYPLNEFYARAGLPLPPFARIEGHEMPEPWRSLLVHQRDMTPTLEAHHRDSIHIEVLGRERRGQEYFREVVLRLDQDGRAVEFGANRILLDRLPPLLQRLVLQEQLPLGHLLKVHEIPHTGRPSAFFRVESDALISRALCVLPGTRLYGRRNTLSDPAGNPISQVIEILPPEPAG